MDGINKNGREIADAYLSSLVDLTNNSKPLINMLTMLAEENIEHAQIIVDAVEQRIAKVEPDLKLPILYLIDSIVKNVGGVYINFFSQSIVNIFTGAFGKVNEEIRKKMFQLRQTWVGVFLATDLNELDIKVNQIDPHWPIIAQKTAPIIHVNPQKIAPAIHLNPNFLGTTTEKDIHTELQIKQRELLELKARKLELELAATQKQLATTTAVPTQPLPPHPTFIPSQLPVSNVRTRIAPVNPTMVNSVRLRDPRLARQPPPPTVPTSQLTSQPINDHIPPKISSIGPIPRINNANFPTNMNRIQRVQPTESMLYNDSANKMHVNNVNNSIDVDGKEAHKHKNSRSPIKSSSKSTSKSTNNNNSNSSKSQKSSSSSSKSSSSKNERSSRSSSSSSKKSKSRKDDKSPQRKKSSSRHRSPTTSRRSSSPGDAQKTSRKSSTYDSKAKSSDSKHSKEKSNDSHSSNSSKMLSTANKTRNRSSRSKSPCTSSVVAAIKATDPITKDIDLRAQLPQPISLTNSLISSTHIDTDRITTTVPTASVPIVVVANSIADRTSNINSEIRDQKIFDGKDIDFRVGLLPNITASSQPAPITDTKKRLSEGSDSNEPKPKKTKSEKIDILFGKEDVDLRIPPPMNAITSTSLTIPPTAVPMAVDTKPSSVAVDITASHSPMNEQTTNQTKPINRDIDLRMRPDFIDDNSQESNEKFKMILMQAQEQVDNKDVDQDQIQSMVQQLIKIKKDSDERKSFKRAAAAAAVSASTAAPVSMSKSAASKLVENDVTGGEAFSSGSEDETIKQSHRVPYKRRRQENDQRAAAVQPSIANNNLTKPPAIDVAVVPPPQSQSTQSQKERRPRKTKWNNPWEEQPKPPPVLAMPTIAPNIIAPFAPLQSGAQPALNVGAGGNDTVRQFTSRNVTGPVWQPNVMPFNCTPVNPLALLSNAVAAAAVATVPPMLGNAQIVMAQHGPSHGPCTAKDRTINIDGIPREIRFYGETAIAFMEANGKEPKEIGFQSGERRVCVDNNESIVLAFNDTYKPFVINGNQYSIRFGTPTRELYIDNEWYECYFGDPAVGIVLNNKLHSVRIDGPAPQVRIGNLRTDLVVGKVDMYIDTQTKVSLFLDAQVQMFQLNGHIHHIQFADYFLSVVIDNTPFPVKYGAMPVKFQLANSEHYIRFSVLPDNIVPGEIYVQNMKRTELQPNLVAPLPTPIAHSIPTLPSLMSIGPNSDAITTANAATNATPNSQPAAAISDTSNPAVASTSAQLPMDINELFQALLARGIINKGNKDASPNKDKEKEKEKMAVVDLSKPETLKKRHPSIIAALYSGIQCSTCGIRFPPEQTMKYSQHLDWHFRENRRTKSSKRQPRAPKLYLPLAEWLQYQEIENEEEREKSVFETQQIEMDSANEDSNQRTESPPPSCVAGPNDNNKACDMCHDPFEQFYNQETEEWLLRNAIRIDENIYHPICYEDYKASLTLDESNLNATRFGDMTTDDNAVDMPVKTEDEPTSIGLTNNNDRIPILDDDDDVIVLPTEEPIIEEIPDDDDQIAKDTTATTIELANGVAVDSDGLNSAGVVIASQDTGISTQPDSDENKDDSGKNNESDVQILEPHISILNLDEYEESERSSNQIDQTDVMPVKIKQEPKYEGYEDDEDDGFEEVGTFEADPAEILEEASVEDSVPMAPIQTQPILITSLDGNIELQDAQPVQIGTNKIKINISKNVQLNKNSINNSENVDNNLAINNKEMADAQLHGAANNKNIIENETDRGENGSSDVCATIDAMAGGGGGGGNAGGDGDAAASNEPAEIQYEVKESIKHVQFKRQPVVRSGLETSGLCSIM